MDKCIMVGCDLHVKTMLLKIAAGAGDRASWATRSWRNDRAGRRAMIADLKQRAAAVGAARLVFTYEACCLGFVLHDELVAAGIECYVLAPTRIARSSQHIFGKTDERDAERLLELLCLFVLMGGKLPAIWVPDRATRDDREVIRTRLEAADKLTRIKCQINCLLKRNGIERSAAPAAPWTVDYHEWLKGPLGSALGAGAGAALASLVRQMEFAVEEIDRLDGQVLELARSARYGSVVTGMRTKGVGVLTAMVVATEFGDFERFANRQQVGAFLGLAPRSHETGEADDRKGRITRQGPGRVRRVLNQASWARIRQGGPAAGKYQRIAARNPRHKKKGVVAVMRDLGVWMWHRGLEAQRAMRTATGGPAGGGTQTSAARPTGPGAGRGPGGPGGGSGPGVPEVVNVAAGKKVSGR